MLSAAVLATFAQQRKGRMSLQIIGKGRLGSLFVDVTEAGDLRAMIKNPDAVLPRLPTDGLRRSIGHGLGDGSLSVIWQPEHGAFSQSTTALISGEIDRDVQGYLESSEQVRTTLVADVHLDDEGRPTSAGGILLQAMPDAELQTFERLSERAWEILPTLLADGATSPATLRDGLDADIELVAPAVPISWNCRCNYERVLNSVRMLTAVDLADMVQKRETAKVECEFCRQKYEVPPEEIEAIYQATLESESN